MRETSVSGRDNAGPVSFLSLTNGTNQEQIGKESVATRESGFVRHCIW